MAASQTCSINARYLIRIYRMARIWPTKYYFFSFAIIYNNFMSTSPLLNLIELICEISISAFWNKKISIVSIFKQYVNNRTKLETLYLEYELNKC